MTNAINSTLAYWILFRAVFGDEITVQAFRDDDDDFYLVKRPSWTTGDYYFEAADGIWKQRHLVIR